MMFYVQQFLWTLFAELIGVACVAGTLYVYWNVMTKNSK